MIKVLVEGQQNQVENFVRCFEYLRQYHIFYRSYLTNKKNTVDDVRLDLFVVNSNPKKRVTEVEMTTKEGKQIRIELLDARVVKMSEVLTIVYGKHYDIF
ncbi:hypothetical protein [Risungbinella massiliensis]|uniref:hypothetical protein n=1 Tax=Risungbinella massiliensis TaxID=1329796 RepID=UPI0005CC81F9|nr:hypothetical protein [Risungbinella massiliensis]